MARVKRGVQARRRHKKVLARAKGYYNARRKVFRVAKQAYRVRAHPPQAEERTRALWITRITRRPPTGRAGPGDPGCPCRTTPDRAVLADIAARWPVHGPGREGARSRRNVTSRGRHARAGWPETGNTRMEARKSFMFFGAGARLPGRAGGITGLCPANE